MIVRTTGIALRVDAFSKTSSIVAWLTPEFGRVSTLAKGARRVKNAFLGQLDVFHTCEILFYSSRHSSLQVLKECAVIKQRQALRADWRTCACASYLCDLVQKLAPAGSPQRELATLIDQILDALDANGAGTSVLHWAELRILRNLGVAPQLMKCVACGRKAPGGKLSVPRGGLICLACKADQGAQVVTIPPDVLAMLRSWQSSDSPLIARRTVCSPAQAEAVDHVLNAFLEFHLEATLSRAIAISLAS